MLEAITLSTASQPRPPNNHLFVETIFEAFRDLETNRGSNSNEVVEILAALLSMSAES